MARYRWAAGMAAGKRVLDLASGTGYGSALLAGAGARPVVSADRSEEAFREAALPGSGARRLTGVLADAARLPFRDARFDLYVSFETIEHVDDDRAVVREARRVLAPGGLFLCSTPERRVVSPGKSLSDRPENPFHFREYALPEFASLLGAEFDEIAWFGQTPCPAPHLRRLEAVSRRSPAAARLLGRLRNLLLLPTEGPARHAPYPLAGAPGHPEVLIGLCGPV